MAARHLYNSHIRDSLIGWYPDFFLDSRVFFWHRITITITIFLLAVLALGLHCLANK